MLIMTWMQAAKHSVICLPHLWSGRLLVLTVTLHSTLLPAGTAFPL